MPELLKAESLESGNVKVTFGKTVRCIVTKTTYDIVETILKAKGVENIDLTQKEAEEEIECLAGVNPGINYFEELTQRGRL